MRPDLTELTICKECGKKFMRTHTAQKLCGVECRRIARDRAMKMAQERKKEKKQREKRIKEMHKREPITCYMIEHGISYAEAQRIFMQRKRDEQEKQMKITENSKKP